MDITNVINKLHADYHNPNNVINYSIKYEFNYHNSHTAIYYTQENNLENYIVLVICVNDTYYLTSIYFSNQNNLYEITPYIPEEVYPLIRPYIFEQDNNSPTKYFKRIFDVILNSQPITTNYQNDINNHPLYIYQNNHNCPFFQCFVRVNMSKDMTTKIRNKFDYQLANQIISYCKRTNKTCRFTPDITKAHDIILSMNE